MSSLVKLNNGQEKHDKKGIINPAFEDKDIMKLETMQEKDSVEETQIQIMGSQKETTNSLTNGPSEIERRTSSLSTAPDENPSRKSTPTNPSRRASDVNSIGSRLSTLDLTKLMENNTEAESDDEEKVKTNAVVDGSMKASIPILPMWLAVTFTVLNIFIPGLGTIISGFSLLCCGSTQSGKSETKLQASLTNIQVGISQFFTFTFLLVGWIWSIIWGIYMIILAIDKVKEEKSKHAKDLKILTTNAFDPNMKSWQV